MHKTFGRVLGVALASILALGGMAGCDSGPKSTEELLERYEALENRGNYTFESDFDITVGGNEILDYITSGYVTPEASHMSTDGSFFGNDSKSERYVELVDDTYVQYRSIDVAGVSIWGRSVMDGISPISSLTTHELLEGGTFAATEDGYTLSVPSSEFLHELIDMSKDALPDIAENAGLMQAYQNSDAVYTFNKDFELTGITCTLSAKGDGATGGEAAASNGTADGTATDTAATGDDYIITIKYTIGNYGTVEADAVAVPQNVKDSAIDIKEALAKAKELAGQVADTIGNAVSELTERAREGLDQVDTYLENVDANEVLDQLTSLVSDAA